MLDVNYTLEELLQIGNLKKIKIFIIKYIFLKYRPSVIKLFNFNNVAALTTVKIEISKIKNPASNNVLTNAIIQSYTINAGTFTFLVLFIYYKLII
jgi:hypothetical protein